MFFFQLLTRALDSRLHNMMFICTCLISINSNYFIDSTYLFYLFIHVWRFQRVVIVLFWSMNLWELLLESWYWSRDYERVYYFKGISIAHLCLFINILMCTTCTCTEGIRLWVECQGETFNLCHAFYCSHMCINILTTGWV